MNRAEMGAGREGWGGIRPEGWSGHIRSEGMGCKRPIVLRGHIAFA